MLYICIFILRRIVGHEKLSEGVWALVSSERLRVISEAGGEGNSIELTARYALVCACLCVDISRNLIEVKLKNLIC